MAISAGGTLYLIFTQVASRGLTFIGNQILLRYLSPKLLGIAVQLELVSVTILYFARESLRVALQRQPVSVAKSKKQNVDQYQTPVNLSYLAIGLGLMIALVSGRSYLRVADLEVIQSPQFRQAFYLYAAATLIELCSEPFFVVIQQHSLYKQRARAETSGAISRCVSACVTAFVISGQNQSPSVLPFAVGQLAYSSILFSLYLQAAYAQASREGFKLLPQTIVAPSSVYFFSFFSKPVLSLATTMYLQSIFKLLLTEGDHLILSFLSSLADQGAFALAANYGGLLARLVFQPIEESSRNTFGRLLSSTSISTSTSQANGNSNAPSGSKATVKEPYFRRSSQNPTPIKSALSHLSTTLKLYTLSSFPFLSLLPPLIPHLAPLILSTHWRTPSTTALLSTYIYLIPLLAVNGILDAFVTSVATTRQLRVQSAWMAGFTGVYGGACYLLLRTWGWGSEGLVWANVVNMISRIVWDVWFVDGWMREHGLDGGERRTFWRESVPGVYSTGMAILLGVLLSSKEFGIGNGNGGQEKKRIVQAVDLDFADVGKIVTGVVLLGSMILLQERKFLLSIVETVLPERLASRIPAFKPKSTTTRRNNKVA